MNSEIMYTSRDAIGMADWEFGATGAPRATRAEAASMKIVAKDILTVMVGEEQISERIVLKFTKMAKKELRVGSLRIVGQRLSESRRGR